MMSRYKVMVQKDMGHKYDHGLCGGGAVYERMFFEHAGLKQSSAG